MSRLIAVFMLALLPFQFSWSAVATYCMHERTTAQSQHVGHHEHNHESKSKVDKAEKTGQSADQFDIDCCLCHGAGVGVIYIPHAKKVISHGDSVGARPIGPLAGVTPTPPDRPQWPFLA